jgi:hypothetical protein
LRASALATARILPNSTVFSFGVTTNALSDLEASS